MPSFIFIIMGCISGIAMAVMGAFNALLAKAVGLLEATFIAHLIGTIVLGVLIFGLGLGRGNWSKMMQVPWYAFLGGLLSIWVILSVAFLIPKIGVTSTNTLTVSSQILGAVMIGLLGLWGMPKAALGWGKIVGMIMLIWGSRLLLFP